MVQRWTIYNPETTTTITWPLNPREGVLPEREKNYTATTTTSPDGQPLIFQGRDKPRTFPFSGAILQEAHYDFFVTWYNADVACQVTDELGNQFWLWLVKFTPKRKNRHSHPWAADYDCLAVVTG